MAFKTILVHLNNERRASRLISAAARLSLAGSAHLIGLFVVPHVPTRSPIFPRISGAIVQGGLESYRQSGERIHKEFEEAVRSLPVVPEWRLYEPRQGTYVDAVLGHARTAELVVVAEKESDWDFADMFDVPDAIAIESGRPTLLVPRKGDLASIGERVLIAWNNSRESARAVFDALPILVAAKEVRVFSVGEPGKPQTTGELAGAEIAAALARHGVRCVVDHVASGGVEPGELVLASAQSRGCDLIVMGCYGRTRFRELVLGGASRHMMHNSTIPVLMSH